MRRAFPARRAGLFWAPRRRAPLGPVFFLRLFLRSDLFAMTGLESAAPADPVRRPSLLILIAVSGIGPLALNLFIPSMPGLEAEFGVPYATVQLTLTLYLIGMAGSQLVYGPLSDRFGRRPPLVIGLGLFAFASLLAALAPSIEFLIAARLLQAVGGSSGIVLSRAIVRDLYGRDKSASVLGYVTMAWVVAPMIAPTVGGFLDGVAGWRSGFFLLAGLGALVCFAAWRALHETHHQRQSLPALSGLVGSYRLLLSRPRFVAYALTLGFSSGVFFSFLAGAPYVMVVQLGLTPLDYGLWFMLVSIGYMTGNGLSGRFSERLGADRMLDIGTGLSLLAAIASLTAALSGALSPITLFGPMLLVALGNGLSIPNGIAAAISIVPSIAGAASGLAGFMQMALGAVTSQSTGLLQAATPWAVFYVMVGSAALAVAMHRLGARRKS